MLPCRVSSLGAASLSWLRAAPHLTVLSSGGTVFTSSSRVSVEHRQVLHHNTLSLVQILPDTVF